MLCIEINENQHKCYCKINKEKQYNELVINFTGKQIFIRFNPDKYADSNNKRRNPKMGKRLEKLLKETNIHIKRIENGTNDELIEIFYLYFNEY